MLILNIIFAFKNRDSQFLECQVKEQWIQTIDNDI